MLPALLLAVLVSALLTAGLFVVGRTADQGSRANTASDAAALAAGTEAAQEIRAFLAGDGLHLGQLLNGGGLDFATISSHAATYASANGSNLVSANFLGFTGPTQWTFEVTVEAKDTVTDPDHGPFPGQGAVPRSQSTSRVTMQLDGLCNVGAFGFGIWGNCLTAPLLSDLCAAPPPPADPVVVPSGSPSPSPTPTVAGPVLPGWLHGHSCPDTGPLALGLTPQIHLVS